MDGDLVILALLEFGLAVAGFSVLSLAVAGARWPLTAVFIGPLTGALIVLAFFTLVLGRISAW